MSLNCQLILYEQQNNVGCVKHGILNQRIPSLLDNYLLLDKQYGQIICIYVYVHIICFVSYI